MLKPLIKYLFILAWLWPLSMPAETESESENNNQLTVTADMVDIQDQSSVSIYSGNARAQKDETYITADTIEIHHPKQKLSSILIVGKPAFVHYVLEDKQDPIEASAQSIHYDVIKEIFILKGMARVIYGNNQILAEQIILNQKSGEMRATARKKSQVKTIFEIKND